MASLFSKALIYLGLVDEDQVGADTDVDEGDISQLSHEQNRSVRQITPEGRRVEPPAATSRTAAVRGNGPSVAGVRQIRSGAQADILVVEEFGDAKILADRVRDRVPVVLDVRHTDSELVRRVVDFSSGLIYALDGTMKKVGEGLVLVLPPAMSLTAEEKRRLASLGAYDLEIAE